MYSWIKTIILLMITSLFVGQLNAQTNPQRADTLKTVTKADTATKAPDLASPDEEIELGEINIEAVIEKPSVAILPKRIEPELGETEFVNRSFEKELKQAPEKPMIMDNRLLAPKKIEDFKEKLKKASKK